MSNFNECACYCKRKNNKRKKNSHPLIIIFPLSLSCKILFRLVNCTVHPWWKSCRSKSSIYNMHITFLHNPLSCMFQILRLIPGNNMSGNKCRELVLFFCLRIIFVEHGYLSSMQSCFWLLLWYFIFLNFWFHWCWAQFSLLLYKE